ncbi:MAG: hypothetical protein ACK45E_04785 [Ignavibacteria bacterium]|jgi:hypothetical protein
MKSRFVNSEWNVNPPTVTIQNIGTRVWVTEEDGSVSSAAIQDVKQGQAWMLQEMPNAYVPGQVDDYSNVWVFRYQELMLDYKALKNDFELYRSAYSMMLEVLKDIQHDAVNRTEGLTQDGILNRVISAVNSAEVACSLPSKGL